MVLGDAQLQQACPDQFNLTLYHSKNLLLIRYKRPLDLGFRELALPMTVLQAVVSEVTWRLCRQALQIPPQQILVEWKP